MTTETETQPAAPATLTSEEKLSAAQATMEGLRLDIVEKAKKGDDFTADTIKYAAAVATHNALFKSVNSGAIDAETSQIGQAILTMVQASKLEDLMGEPVSSVYWTLTPGEGENGPVLKCGINVKARATSTKGASGGGGSSPGRAGKETFSVNGGAAMTPKDFINEYATEKTRGNTLFSSGKWPTKPSFIAEAIAALEATGTGVVRTPVTE